MIRSKDKNIAVSFIMGTDDSIKKKLDSINATYKIEDGKYYLTKIPRDHIEQYEEFIKEYLKPGFWNEYILEEAVFIFKTLDNRILYYVFNENNEKEVLELCNEYAGFNKTSVIEMLLGEPFYHENTIVD